MPHRRLNVTAGFSPRLIADVEHLEHTRNYLGPNEVEAVLRRWAQFVRKSPYRRFTDVEAGCEYFPAVCDCCRDPYEARQLLEFVARALPRKSARELRRRLRTLDDLY